MRFSLVAVVLLVACCPPPKPAKKIGDGATAATCDSVRAKVEGLYRAEAQDKEPKRVDAATAENVHMAMTDCAKDPAKLAACMDGVQSVSELEQRCLVPLDDEGSEGDALGRKPAPPEVSPQ